MIHLINKLFNWGLRSYFMTDGEHTKCFFGYTSEELGKILTDLEKHYNFYEMFEWFLKNAPDQTYVTERTLYGIIDNFKHRKIIKFPRVEHVCIACNKIFFNDNVIGMYCSERCQYQEYRKRNKLRKENPDYKPPITRIKPDTVYEIKRRVTYDESFETEITGNDSLFCDADFLEKFLGKKIKKTDECEKIK